MKQYKVYLCDIKWSNIKNSDDKVIKGGIRSGIIFYDGVEYKDISKISEEQFWYLVNKNLKQELDQYKNNWEELKKELMKKAESASTIKNMLGDNAKVVNPHIDILEIEYNYFLNKMKELEEGK